MQFLNKFYTAPLNLFRKIKMQQYTLLELALIWVIGTMVALAFTGNIIGTLITGTTAIAILHIIDQTDNNVAQYFKEKRKSNKGKSMLDKAKNMKKWK